MHSAQQLQRQLHLNYWTASHGNHENVNGIPHHDQSCQKYARWPTQALGSRKPVSPESDTFSGNRGSIIDREL